MHPSDRLIAITGVFLVFAAAWLIVGSANIGLVTRGSIQVSDDASNSFSAEMNSPSSLSFSEVKLPSDVEGMTPPRLNVILSDDQMNVGGGNPQNENFDISNRFIGSANFFRKKEGKIEPVIEFVPNSFIVEFDSTIAVENQRAQSSALDAALNQIADYSIRKLAPTHQNDAVSRFAVVNFKGDAQDTRLLQKRIEAVSGVSSVSPNYIAKTTQAGVGNTAPLGSGTPPATRTVVTPNDPYFSQQYMHDKIDSLAAWTQTKGSGSVVAVIDTGVDYQHPDLSANIWKNGGEIPNNGIDDEGNGYVDDVIGYDFVDTLPDPSIPQEDYLNEDNDPSDYYGHGTHVAGIIAAVTNNQKGVAGVCPECKIMSLRAGYAPGYLAYADIVQAIIYATDNGAHVINMSFGGSYNDAAMKSALDYAYAQDVVLVAAAGNSSTDDPTYPGSYENVIGVTATDEMDNRAFFSNYGYWTDITAPGVNILSAVPTKGYWLSQFYPPLSYDPNYANFSGTSMAAPVVAGVAGLLNAKYPLSNNDSVASAILTGTKSIVPYFNYFFGNGIVNSNKGVLTLGLDATAVASMQENIFSQTVTGDTTIFGTGIGSTFGRGKLSVFSKLYNGVELSEFTTFFSQPLYASLLGTLKTGDLSNGIYSIELSVENHNQQKIRSILKPLSIENVVISSPEKKEILNLSAPTVSFIGTIAGDISSYIFEYDLDKQGYSSTGFVYPNNTTVKTNELLATWSPPSSAAVEKGQLSIRITRYLKSGKITKEVFAYHYDSTISPGFPVVIPTLSAQESGSVVQVSSWDIQGDGHPELVIADRSQSVDGSLSSAMVYLLNEDGQYAPGWPVAIPSTVIGPGGYSYNLYRLSGGRTSQGDVDGDGDEELLVLAHVFAPFIPYGGPNNLQSAVFAYNEDGTFAPGFPIFTNVSQSTGPLSVSDASPIFTDVDADGQSEIIVLNGFMMNAPPNNWQGIISIAKKDHTGKYAFASPIFTQFPSNNGAVYSLVFRTVIAVQNVDSTSEKEIAILTPGYWDISTGKNYAYAGVFRLDGSPLPGWPVLLENAAGQLDLFANNIALGKFSLGWVLGVSSDQQGAVTSNNQLDVFSMQGQSLAGWPVSNVGAGDAPIIFSDVDGDGNDELLATAFTKLYVYEENGVPSAGWPKDLTAGQVPGGFLPRSPITLLRDGEFNVIASAGDSYWLSPFTGAYSFTTNSDIPIFSSLLNAVSGHPLISDLKNDGGSELILGGSFWEGTSQNFMRSLIVYAWQFPGTVVEGDWPVYMHDVGRTNSSADPNACQDLTSTAITSSISICPGTYSLQNGITIRADNTIPIIVTCNGTQFLGYNAPGSVGITIDSTLNQQGTVELRGCRVDEYSSAVKVSKYVNLTLEDNQFSNTVSISPSGVPLLSNPSVAGTISNNTFTNNASLSISYFGNLSILDNTFSVNGQGIGISNSDNVSVAGNHITHANTSSVNGITVLSSTNGTIFNNTIDGPFQYSVYTNVPSGGNYVVSENNFYIGARDQSFSPGSVTWYNAASQRGNYWSVHTCTDTQAPIGICDNAYAVYSPTQNPDPKDLYPLANPV